MKKSLINIIYVIFTFMLFVPFSVNALTCNEKILSVDDGNFRCSGVEGNLSFTFNGEDFGKYLKLRDDGYTIDIDPSITFPSNVEIAIIEVKDSKNTSYIRIKNNKYTTTTTKQPENIIVVKFDKQDDSELIEKKCSIVTGSDSCSVVSPKLDEENFNGWGTQPTCKEGISGTIKVSLDVTYYACYNEEEEDTTQIISNGLKITDLRILDSNTLEEIDYGELDDSKDTYNIRVLYDVLNLNVNVVTGSVDTLVEVSGNKNLVVGNNKVYINLTDKTNNKKTYTLNVERLDEGEELEKIHYLSSLVIGGSNINFDKEVFEYTVTIEKDIDKLLINTVSFYEDDIVTVKGNIDLINNSKVYIEVTGDDGNVTTYTINIIKEENIDNVFIISIVVGVILLISIIIIFIILSRNNKKDKLKNIKKKEVKKNKEKIKKAKNSAKNLQPEVLVNNSNDSDDIEVLKF